MDRLGFLYFADRAGETYRWNGENVSTCEVQAALLTSANHVLAEAVVFGTKLPGKHAHLGKCGVAAVVLRPDVAKGAQTSDWRADLFAALDASGLSPNAVPRVLRVAAALPKTATHKYVTAKLADAGLQALNDDALFLRDAHARTFRPLDAQLRAALESGDFRV